MSGFFGGFFMLAYFALAIWVTYMFYRALARIGEELSDIRRVLEQRLPLAPPEPVTRRPDLSGT